MAFELLLSYRYLKGKKRHSVISLVTFLSVTGVAVGVSALIVVLSAINGFNYDLRQKILGLTPHVTVFERGQEMLDHEEVRKRLLEIEDVVAASPFILREVLLQGPTRSVQVVVRGVDPATVESVMPLREILHRGEVADLIPSGTTATPKIIVGKGVLKDLKVPVGSIVVLVSPEGTLTPWGNLPKWRRAQVVGVFDAGYWDFDSRVVLMSIPAAQKLFEIPGRVTGIELKVKDPSRASEVRKRIQESPLGTKYVAQDWTQVNRSLMAALATQKRVIFVILFCIVGVASLLIISILIMTVMEKRRDIAILKAMGARSVHVMKLFVLHGLAISSLGISLGMTGGLVVSWNLEWIVHMVEKIFRVDFLPEDIYYIGRLTSRSDPEDLLLIVMVTFIMSTLASLYPSWKASRMDPVEILRYE